jgi:hypothetical protein
MGSIRMIQRLVFALEEGKSLILIMVHHERKSREYQQDVVPISAETEQWTSNCELGDIMDTIPAFPIFAAFLTATSNPS